MGCSESRQNLNKHKKLPSLFNYQLKGIWDEEIKQSFDKQHADPQNSFVLNLTPQQIYVARQKMNEYLDKVLQMEVFTKYEERCQIETKNFDATQFGSDNQNLEVFVVKPKQFQRDEKLRPCIIYAHGGGAVMMAAKYLNPIVSRMVLDSDCIAINVKYRLAPQAKAPKGILDYYSALKWALKNSEELGIDTNRICLMGDSGGGYICTGTGVKLVQEGEQHLVKLLVAIVPMTSNYYLRTKPQDMKQIEKLRVKRFNSIYQMIAEDPYKQMQDPFVFPNEMGDKIAKKFPKTVVFTAEFDFLRQSAEELAQLLRKNGRLLDICIRNGVDHAFYGKFTHKRVHEHFEDMKKVLKKWLC